MSAISMPAKHLRIPLMVVCALHLPTEGAAYVIQHHSIGRQALAAVTSRRAVCEGLGVHRLQRHRTAMCMVALGPVGHTDANQGPVHGIKDTSKSALEFHQWFKDNGADTSLTLSYFGEMRGMMATRAIAQGDELLSYPRAATMDMASLKCCPCADLVDETYWKQSPWFVQFGLWLLSEETKGPDSAWAPYIASLPRTLSLALDWTDAQLSMLSYKPLVETIKRQRCDFSAILAATAPRLLSNKLSIDRLEWAMRIALSRTFPIAAPQDAAGERALEPASWRSDRALVPALDLINHASLSRAKYSYDPVSDRFALVSDTGYAPGEQVLNSYILILTYADVC
jgi:hypothetical protein